MGEEQHRVTCEALRTASPEALAGLEADLAFCHPAIVGLSAIDAAAGVIELRTLPIGAGDVADLEKQVHAVVESSIRSYRFAEATPPLWSHDAKKHYAGGRASLDAFIKQHTVTTGPGQLALIGPAANLREWLDSRTRGLADELGAETWHTPNIEMIDDLLARTGYLASYPQFATFGFHLRPHFEGVARFAAAAKKQPPNRAEDLRELVPGGFIMEPAACHNIFRALRGVRIQEGRTITALGGVYRYEGFRFQPLLRQWEYSVREVVFAGAPAWVEAGRLRLVALAQALIGELDLDATIEVATDPFFVSEAASARAFQLMGSTKIEIKLRIDDTHTTAAASFNRHGHHFSEPMDVRITDGGDTVETACAGFGLERWMAAFVARWGADPMKWPHGAGERRRA